MLIHSPRYFFRLPRVMSFNDQRLHLELGCWSIHSAMPRQIFSAYARVLCNTVRIVATVKRSRKYSIGGELRAGSCRGPGARRVKACGATWSSSLLTRSQPSARRAGIAARARPRPRRPRPRSLVPRPRVTGPGI